MCVPLNPTPVYLEMLHPLSHGWIFGLRIFSGASRPEEILIQAVCVPRHALRMLSVA